ncbi:hypothetical protein [Amycolatopsis sp. H20-H5]|nr:hypothetical protein [Amycolatopsis sp. H20-H5]MEC3978076.1 hypothetical protein [Amycolatopsis sp. H20-H5]
MLLERDELGKPESAEQRPHDSRVADLGLVLRETALPLKATFTA